MTNHALYSHLIQALKPALPSGMGMYTKVVLNDQGNSLTSFNLVSIVFNKF